MSPYPVTVLCRTLGVSRSTAYRREAPRGPYYAKAADPEVAQQIRAILRTRGSDGHKRVTALVNTPFGTHYNRKRIRRAMRLLGLALPARADHPRSVQRALVQRHAGDPVLEWKVRPAGLCPRLS